MLGRLLRFGSAAERPVIRRAVRIVADKVRRAGVSGTEYLQVRKGRISREMKLAGVSTDAALVGCGVMGGKICAATKMLPGFRLAHFVDSRADAARRLQARYSPDGRIHDSLAAMLKALGPSDVLIVASNADSHVPIATTAIQQGVHRIFLEKPIGTCLGDAQQLAAEAANAGVQLTVDHTRRWAPVFEAAKRMVESGVIGKPHSVNYIYGRAGFAMIGSHLFDLTRWLFESDIVRVRAMLDDVQRESRRGRQYVDPSGRSDFELKNGIHGQMDLSDRIELQQKLMVITGESGRLEIDQRQGRLRLLGPSGRLWEQEFVNAQNLLFGVAAALNDLCLDRPSRCAAEDGCAALEAAIGVIESGRGGGRWVDLPLTGELVNESFPFA